MNSTLPIRRSDVESVVVGNMQDGVHRYYDQNLERTVVKLMTGDCYIAADPQEMLVTILGSCISVCMRDPILGLGGMNHFLLPEQDTSTDPTQFSTRYGAFAMESLINGILERGGHKSRLEVKLFGGGNVIHHHKMIGSNNVAFVRSYLERENIAVTAQHMGGEHPRRIHYFPDSGRVRMRLLKRKEDFYVAEAEAEFCHRLDDTHNIDLFDDN